MTTADPITGEITSQPQGEPLSHSQAVLLLGSAASLKTEIVACERTLRELKKSYDLLLSVGDSETPPGILRQYVIAHREERLRNGETGIELEVTTGTKPRTVDFENLTERFPDAVVALAKRDLLSLKLGSWDKHSKNFAEADQVRGFIMPGGESLRLEIKKDK